MPITFSEQFNISKEVLEITGVFDVILDIDTRVFIDPALLELCTEPEFLDARKKVEKYFSDIITLLRHSKSQTDMYRKRAERMLTFTELSGTCFGYSQNGTGGNAIGSVLRKTILNTIQDLMLQGGERMKYKLLKDLYDCFCTPPELHAQKQEIDECHQALSKVLGKLERRLVLQIIDAKDRIAEETSIDSFIAGFELAWKLSVELNHYENERSVSCQTAMGSGARFASKEEEK